MNKIWQTLPMIAVLSACGGGGDGDTPTTPRETETEANTYQLTLSGDVLTNNGVENLIDIYAGSIKLGQTKSSPEGSYSTTLNIDEETYNQAKNNELRLISPLSNVQLIKLSSYKLSDAITNKSITANISSFSTANYALADLNNNGVVSTIEWQAYQGSQQKDLINKNLIKFATVVTSVIDKPVTLKTANPLSWLAALKIPANWNQWYNQHQQAFDTAWQTNINNQQLTLEAKRYLISDSKQLNDYTQAEIVKPPQYTAACQLNISVDEPSFESTKVEIGQTWQLSSQVTDSVTGSLISEEPNWKSLNLTLARVSNSGVLDSLAAGSTEIMASYKLGTSICTDSLAVTITDTQQPEPAKLTSIAIDAIPATLVEKESITLNVMGSMSDKSVHNITDKVTWTAIPATTVRFDSNSLVALKTGKVTIAASYEDFNDTKTFIIEQAKPLPPKLTTIRIYGYYEARPAGESWQLEAFGLFSDRSASDLSSKVDWQSSNIEVATVANGLVTAKAEGTAIITVSLDGISEKQHVTVTAAAPAVNHLTITGEISDLNKGETTSLSVFAIYDDDTNADITDQVIWSSNDNNIASVTNGNLHAVNVGTTSVTATWQHRDGKLLAISQDINVLPATLVSVVPDILSGTYTMKEGKLYRSFLTFTFSDNSKKIYRDITLGSEVDASGLPIVLKVDKDYNAILAHRAGKTAMIINDIPSEILQYLPPELDNHGSIKIDINVEDNPNLYQWHRKTVPTVGANSVNIQNIINGKTVYRFWHQALPITSDMTTQAVLLTTFDGSNRFEKQVVLPLRGLVSNQMVDGGGNGYTLLISPDDKGAVEYYIYDLLNGSKHRVNFQNAPFTGLLNEKNTVQPFGFTPEGNLITLVKADDSSYTAYIYRKHVDDARVRMWIRGDTVQGENLNFAQLPSYSDHLVVFEKSISNRIPTKYHFINRTTGRVDNVASLQYPNTSLVSYCNSITIIPSKNIDNFGAYCDVKISENKLIGHWLWEDIEQPPKAFWKYRNSTLSEQLPIAMRGKNDRIIASKSYTDIKNNKHMVSIMHLNESNKRWYLSKLSSVSHNTVSPYYSSQYPLSETSSLLLENPHVPGEMVIITNNGIAIKLPYKNDWRNSRTMSDIPEAVKLTEHIFQLNNTWYIISNTNSNEIWSFQMRNPDQALAQ